MDNDIVKLTIGGIKVHLRKHNNRKKKHNGMQIWGDIHVIGIPIDDQTTQKLAKISKYLFAEGFVPKGQLMGMKVHP